MEICYLKIAQSDAQSRRIKSLTVLLFLKAPEFQWNVATSQNVSTSRNAHPATTLTHSHFLQLKYATPDDASVIGLKFILKDNFRQSEGSGILV